MLWVICRIMLNSGMTCNVKGLAILQTLQPLHCIPLIGFTHRLGFAKSGFNSSWMTSVIPCLDPSQVLVKSFTEC